MKAADSLITFVAFQTESCGVYWLFEAQACWWSGGLINLFSSQIQYYAQDTDFQEKNKC